MAKKVRRKLEEEEASAFEFPPFDEVAFATKEYELTYGLSLAGMIAVVTDFSFMQHQRNMMQTAADSVLASLWDPLLAETSGSVEAYVAHVVLNLVDWQIRFYPDTADISISCAERAFGWVDAGRFIGSPS